MLVVSGLHLILFQTGAETDNVFEVIIRARWVLLTGTLFALLQIGAWYLFTLVIPDEDLFAKHGFNTEQAIDMRRSWIFAAILGSLMVMIISTVFIAFGTDILFDQWNYYGLLVIAAMMSPLLAPAMLTLQEAVSYTHLTLPTNREV